MRARIKRFMQGRYGQDSLNRALSGTGVGLLIVDLLVRWLPIQCLGLGLMGLSVFRMYSRNIYRRQSENRLFRRLFSPAAKMVRQQREMLRCRKTHRYFRCPRCKRWMRVPRGAGRVKIKCPGCDFRFEKTV